MERSIQIYAGRKKLAYKGGLTNEETCIDYPVSIAYTVPLRFNYYFNSFLANEQISPEQKQSARL